ncbi:phosphate ABC transporter permease subunit PstC [Lapillicoccus jejuensis]|uniref:Phosphate transport system permease protein n=1 Tax=Lapillicoccus jejuensis TaxID=402171 RepID=A0A542E177_9MICO|nr:phosphate ABC transporter permease subunit PstC [Lapillicoccus jejuensis]TQJ09100.1 phosphate ABC transporter membrane protein 1 (PhoT family) [Lapillicoccus jejuensis]
MAATPLRSSAPERRPLRGRRPTDTPSAVDRAFTGATTTSGLVVLLLLTLIAVFLVREAWPALEARGWSFFTTVEFSVVGNPPVLGVLGLLVGTVVVALIAVLIAVPVSVCTALFITDVAQGRVRSTMMGLLDLLAALPSLLYGLWGFAFLTPYLEPVARFLSTHLGFIPLFRVEADKPLISSYFFAGLVVSLMVLPIITSVVREVFMQVPPGEKEAALALGSTRWDMLRTVVVPFGRGGIIGGSMLGLGRALGETIAVSLLLPQSPISVVHVFQYGGSTIAGFIAVNTGASGLALSGLLAAGLVLFAFTLTTNFVASLIISRSRSGAGVDA